jgi:intracellular multiplication protein IcmC
MSSSLNVLNNLAGNLVSVQRLVSATAYIIGLAFAFKAIHTLKAFGESKMMSSSNANLKEPIAYMVVAVVFIYIPTILGIFFRTTFGASSPMLYPSATNELSGLSALFSPTSMVGRSLGIIFQTIGMIAFVRGWILIARHTAQGQPPGGTGKGLMHVFGGILAMNIVGTLEIINNTLYGTR